MAAKRPGEVLWIEETDGLKTGLGVGRQVDRGIGLTCDFCECHLTFGNIFNGERPVLERHLVGLDTHLVRRDLGGFFLHLNQGHQQCLASDRDRTTAERPGAERLLFRIAVHDIDIVVGNYNSC